MWEFMIGENDMNDELMQNWTRCEWWIDDELNDICIMNWIMCNELNWWWNKLYWWGWTNLLMMWFDFGFVWS